MRGFTSGYAVPQYVVDAPGGGGKVPLNPDYLLSLAPTAATLRNFQGATYTYPMPEA